MTDDSRMNDSLFNVLIITNSRGMGGMEEVVRLIAANLDRESFRVHAACPDWEPTRELAERLRVAADELLVVTTDERHGKLNRLRECWRVAAYVRRHRIRAVHAHCGAAEGLALLMLTLRLTTRARIYVTEHTPPVVELKRHRLWVRGILTSAMSGMIFVSLKGYHYRRSLIRTNPRRAAVVDNGIDYGKLDAVRPSADRRSAVRQSLGIPVGAAVVGCAVRLASDKGLDDLVDAFALVAADHPEAWMLLVGDGPSRSSLEERVRDRGVSDRVVFTGHVAEPAELVATMDVFALPVPVGTASIALLEAMALGLPAVISFGAPGEAVRPGESGFWAEPNSPESLAGHLRTLVADPELRVRMGQFARELVESHYNARRLADELGNIYAHGIGAVSVSTRET